MGGIKYIETKWVSIIVDSKCIKCIEMCGVANIQNVLNNFGYKMCKKCLFYSVFRH